MLAHKLTHPASSHYAFFRDTLHYSNYQVEAMLRFFEKIKKSSIALSLLSAFTDEYLTLNKDSDTSDTEESESKAISNTPPTQGLNRRIPAKPRASLLRSPWNVIRAHVAAPGVSALRLTSPFPSASRRIAPYVSPKRTRGFRGLALAAMSRKSTMSVTHPFPTSMLDLYCDAVVAVVNRRMFPKGGGDERGGIPVRMIRRLASANMRENRTVFTGAHALTALAGPDYAEERALWVRFTTEDEKGMPFIVMLVAPGIMEHSENDPAIRASVRMLEATRAKGLFQFTHHTVQEAVAAWDIITNVHAVWDDLLRAKFATNAIGRKSFYKNMLDIGAGPLTKVLKAALHARGEGGGWEA